MTLRSDETKRIAKRIDITYSRRPSWFKLWRRWVSGVTLVVIGLIAAVAALANFGPGKPVQRWLHSEKWLNPGPLTQAHAHFEQNCAACHDHDGKGGFLKTVSDSACMNCHEGAAHATVHPIAATQPAFAGLVPAPVGEKDVGQSFAMLNPKDANDAKAVQLTNPHDHTKAANCVSCHVEHRSRDMLVGTANELCTQCHENLQEHVAAGHAVTVQSSVTKFATGAHPPFGRALLAAGIHPSDPMASTRPTTDRKAVEDAWLPNLRLKFSHKTHYAQAKGITCASCHELARPDPLAKALDDVKAAEVKTAVQLPTDGPEAWASDSPRGYMQPVNYEKHCQACHAMEFTKKGRVKVTIPHQQIELARAVLADPTSAVRQTVYSDPKLLKSVEGGDDDDAPDDSSDDSKKPAKGAAPVDPVTGTINNKVVKLREDLAKFAKPVNDAGVKDLKDRNLTLKAEQTKQLDALSKAVGSDGAALAEALLVNPNAMTVTCAKCHYIEGQPELVYSTLLRWKSGKNTWPAGAPEPQRLASVPTGIATNPRHWFSGAKFKHDAHRDVSCTNCHVGIENDNDDAGVRLPTLESCAQCHKDSSDFTGGARFVEATCVTCHHFHERSVEPARNGRLANLPESDPATPHFAATTQPVKVPG